ncbi:hypothetical protein MBM_07488 [Drepanopeziza brunnea f. sp. 'multigermtubi' MB_m1]|uniref:Uncharacterized protein n=1 Tax=Marssonina brunnea f. sp. multigermtubi (strain MB_m1) TaxID=1072389 RepID=K1X064_MARBU|nr:uncharacterized protein MBM_07488 [Drepanopeziza brunnea f. sp. 'multigermtubi' MB_m1]EKD14258.1 hypothetical protein MBM_07488 [Drepanopeziza brunnea f. sp. 'multigermtubi' MB_m1]
MVHGPLDMPRLACQQSKDPQLDNLSKGPDDEMSSISFDLNELLYAKLDSEITARAIVNDFLDAKCKRLKDYDFFTMTKDNTRRGLKFATLISLKEHLLSKGVWCPLKQKGYANRMEIKEQQATPLSFDSKWTENLTDDEDNTLQPPPPPLRSPKGKEKEEEEEIRKLREEFAKERRDIEQNIKISVPNLSNSKGEFSNPRGGSSTLGRTDKLLRSFNRPRIDKKDTKGIRIAKNAPKGTDITKLEPRLVTQIALAILTMTDERETKEISKEIEATDTERGFGNGPLKDPGFGNEPLKDSRRGRTTGNYIGNPLPIRLLAKHNTLAYGTLSAFDDDDDDFLELRATDLYLRAKELALFARSFLKELKYSGPDDDFKTQLSLRDDRSLVNKLYSACKNVLKTTIARMNLAFTFTAAVADIRRAIAFATELTPIWTRNTNALFKTANTSEFIAGLLDEPPESSSHANISKGFVTTYGTFDADEVYKQLEIQTAFHALTSQIETQNVPTGKVETYMASKYSENVFIGLMINSGAANFFTASLP